MAGFEPGPRDPDIPRAGMSLTPSFDVIEKLPTNAADRLRALRRRFTDQNLLIPKHEQMKEASDTKQRAEARLKQLTAPRADGGFGLKERTPRS